MLVVDVSHDQELLIGDVRIKFKRKSGAGVRVAIDASRDIPVRCVEPGHQAPRAIKRKPVLDKA